MPQVFLPTWLITPFVSVPFFSVCTSHQVQYQSLVCPILFSFFSIHYCTCTSINFQYRCSIWFNFLYDFIYMHTINTRVSCWSISHSFCFPQKLSITPTIVAYIRTWNYFFCLYISPSYCKSMDRPGKVANPARGQLNRENEYFPVPVRAWEFGLARRVRQSRPASVRSSPYSV